jgi:hypothetical protein
MSWARNLEIFESSYTETENAYGDVTLDLDSGETGIGYFFWFCLPGCLPDSEPFGPYASKQDAFEAAKNMFDYGDEGDEDITYKQWVR